MRDASEFADYARRHWWLIVSQAVIAALVLFGAVALFDHSSNTTTTHLVLRPASSLPATQVPGAIDGLRPDGSLVQTVLHVLGSDRLLQSALAASKPTDPSRYSVTATVQPGSAFFDQEVLGPDAEAVRETAKNLSAADATYVRSAYTAYALDVVGTDDSSHDSFPPQPAVILLVVLFGAAFGLAIVLADWWFLEPRRTRARVHAVSLASDEAPAESVSERLASQ